MQKLCTDKTHKQYRNDVISAKWYVQVRRRTTLNDVQQCSQILYSVTMLQEKSQSSGDVLTDGKLYILRHSFTSSSLRTDTLTGATPVVECGLAF